MLISNAHYVELDASAAGISPKKTIVIESKGSSRMLFWGILWTTLMTIAFGFFFYTFIADPETISFSDGYVQAINDIRNFLSRVASTSDCYFLIPFAIAFIGTGLLLIYFGLKAVYSKGWIAVTDDAIYCMRGLFYNPKKYKRFPCNTPTAQVYMLPSLEDVKRTEYKIVLGGPDGSITFASGLLEPDAIKYREMFASLLAGKEIMSL